MTHVRAASSLIVAGLALMAGGAAAHTGDGLLAALAERGFTHVEVTIGPSQVKIEASDGTIEVESVIDKETRTEIAREVKAADNDDEPGHENRRSDSDFLDDDEKGRRRDRRN